MPKNISFADATNPLHISRCSQQPYGSGAAPAVLGTAGARTGLHRAGRDAVLSRPVPLPQEQPQFSASFRLAGPEGAGSREVWGHGE